MWVELLEGLNEVVFEKCETATEGIEVEHCSIERRYFFFPRLVTRHEDCGVGRAAVATRAALVVGYEFALVEGEDDEFEEGIPVVGYDFEDVGCCVAWLCNC